MKIPNLKKVVRSMIVFIIAIAMSLSSFASESINVNSSFSVKFIDVGQADAALVECDGKYMLIDGGNKSDSSRIYSILKNANINYLDMIVATHPHEDHIGGIPGALNFASAGVTLSPTTEYDSEAFEDFAKYANQKGGGITIPKVGDKYSLGSAEMTVIGVNASNDANNSSIVLKVKYGETEFLFTGDAGREAEQAILDSGADISASVLKVGHHGSDSSTTYPFLREIMPACAIISVGAGNSYGHPSDNTLSRLKDAGVSVYRTDINGDITVSSDGKALKVNVSKTGNANAAVINSAPKAASYENGIAASVEQQSASEPIAADYIINKNTKKFHYPSCRSVKQMKESNKMVYNGSSDELKAQGYSPCGNCRP